MSAKGPTRAAVPRDLLIYLSWTGQTLTSSSTKFSTVFLATAKSRILELLAFDEYCRFDTSALFRHIKRASLYMPKESRSIKTAIFIESLQFQRPRGRVNCQTRARAPRARHAGRKFTKIYGNPRVDAARAPCIDFTAAKNTVHESRNAAKNLRSACEKRSPRGRNAFENETIWASSRARDAFTDLLYHCKINLEI